MGSHLTFKALAAGCPVCVLVREKGLLSPHERFRRVAEFFGYSDSSFEELLPRVKFVAGDITRRRFGMSKPDWSRLADGVDEVIHAAAFIEFDADMAGEAARTNIDGTRNVLELAKCARARFLHVSTAYVAGDRRGTVCESELVDSDGFKNVYEETKWQAEKLVHDTCVESELDYAVFRPGILIGRTTDGATFRFNNIYSFLKAFCVIRARQTRARHGSSAAMLEAWGKERVDLALRVEGARETTKNLVPVDYATDAIWRIVRDPACTGRTFHITNPDPPSNERLRQVFRNLFNVDGIDYVTASSFEEQKATMLEKAVRQGTRNYAPYMFDEPVFDRTNTNLLVPDYDECFPSLNDAFFARMLIFAMDVKWGKSLPLNRGTGGQERYSDRQYCHEYFSDFLAPRMNRRLVENLRNLNASFRIGITDGVSASWRIRIRDGEIVAIEDDEQPVECTFETGPATFRRVAEGRMSPQQAFFDRRVEIDGDVEKALSVVSALSEFFEKYPCVMAGACDDTVQGRS